MKRFIVYLVIGGLSTLIQLAILFLLVEFVAFKPIVASVTGYLLSSIFNYIANYYFTFKSGTGHLSAVIKYYVMVALGLALNTFIFSLSLWLLLQVTTHEQIYLVAQLFATACVMVVNFLVLSRWVYRP